MIAGRNEHYVELDANLIGRLRAPPGDPYTL